MLSLRLQNGAQDMNATFVLSRDAEASAEVALMQPAASSRLQGRRFEKHAFLHQPGDRLTPRISTMPTTFVGTTSTNPLRANHCATSSTECSC